MPSSTSNFDFPNHRSPTKNWLFILGLTLVTTGLLVAGAEVFWRSRGHSPSIVDSPEFWSLNRASVSDGDPKHVVLIGASRIQLGFSTDVFRKRYSDHKITQLAVDGQLPIATLRDLADDKRFRGTVICSIIANGFNRSHWSDQQDSVDRYHDNDLFYQSIDKTVWAFLQSHLVVLSAHVRMDTVLKTLASRGSFPSPNYLVTRYDRSRLADYSLLDIEAHRKSRVESRMASKKKNPPTPKTWMEDVGRIEQWVKQITNRGGEVVFIRFPTSDEHWKVDEEEYPKSAYWDRMAAFTSAKTFHFMDYPHLTQFELPDTSHLDYRDSPAFTNYLLDEFEKQGILPAQ